MILVISKDKREWMPEEFSFELLLSGESGVYFCTILTGSDRNIDDYLERVLLYGKCRRIGHDGG